MDIYALIIIIVVLFILMNIIGMRAFSIVTNQTTYIEKLEKQALLLNAQSNILLTMASMINHDLKNSVENVEFAATELTRMLETKDFDILEDVEEILRISAQQQTERLKGVNELLRIVKKQDDIKITSENIQEVLLDLLHREYFEATVHVKNSLNFQLDINKNLFEIVADNILKNAMAHNDQPLKKINIYAKDDEIIFEDNGIGFPVDKLNQLKQFGAKGVKSLGTGQGLFIITNILDIMGWGLRIENTGSGSKFILKYK